MYWLLFSLLNNQHHLYSIHIRFPPSRVPNRSRDRNLRARPVSLPAAGSVLRGPERAAVAAAGSLRIYGRGLAATGGSLAGSYGVRTD